MNDSQPQAPSPEIAALRVEYRKRSLSEDHVHPDPIRQFTTWLQEAIAAGALEPTAMALATCADNAPSVRMVLLKGVDAEGFVFFTNYQSRKARELEAVPHRAALAFYWAELERQVRVEGLVTRTSAAESDAYFDSRPVQSRIGAAVSPQSRPIASRAELEQRMRELAARYPDGNIPRPAEWGGYRLMPEVIEFWQGRPSRLHDRIEYRRVGGEWRIGRLAP